MIGTNDLQVVGAAEIADSALLPGGSWTVVVTEADVLDETVSAIQEELGFALSEGGQPGAKTITPIDARELASELVSLDNAGVVLISHFERLSNADVADLDLWRNRFINLPPVVILTSPTGAARIAEHAPNLWSWVGPRCVRFDRSVGALDAEARLVSLREAAQMSDEEVIRKAEVGELEADPIFAEWLVLLGRGDLIGN